MIKSLVVIIDNPDKDDNNPSDADNNYHSNDNTGDNSINDNV